MRMHGQKHQSKKIATLALAIAAVVAFSFTFEFTAGQPAPADEEFNAALASETPVAVETEVEAETEEPIEQVQALNEIEDDEEYEGELRDILNDYYTSGMSQADIAAFTAGLDERSQAIVSRYQAAALERSATDLNYEKETVLVMTEASVSDSEIKKAVDETIGNVITISAAGDTKIAEVELTTEYSVKDAAMALSEEDVVIMAQPNFKYSLSEDDLEAVSEAIETETTDVEETAKETIIEEDIVSDTENTTEDTTVDADEATVEVMAVANDAYGVLKDVTNKDFGDAGINVFSAWDSLKTNGTKVKVGVIDTGVKADHEDLVGIVDTAKSATIEGGSKKVGTIGDDNSHGTHVCGIIAAKANNGKGMSGVAAGYRNGGKNVNDVVSLIVVDAMYGGSLYSRDIYMALEYLTDQGCKVINMSIGGPGADGLIEKGLEYAYDNGVVCVAAAGNESTQNLAYPSDSSKTISVINANAKNSKAASSNYGVDKDIAAPGTLIFSTVPTNKTYTNKAGKSESMPYAYKTGTSMASPVVTGVVAMAFYQDSNLSVRDARNLIYASTANNSFSNTLGFGYLDAKKTVENAKNRVSTVSAVQFNTAAKTIYTGDTVSVEYRVLPGNTNQTSLNWTSKNEAVATVKDGQITGVAPGTCTITGTVGGKSATMTVTVKERYTKVSNNESFTETKAVNQNSAISRLWSGDKKYTYNGMYMNGYKLHVAKGEKITMTAASSDLNAYMNVFNANGSLIASNDNANGTDAQITYTSAKEQDIFVEVSESPYAGKAVVGTGNITFTVGKVLQTTGLTVVTTDYTSVTLKWNKTDEAAGYDICRYDPATKKSTKVGTVNGADTTTFKVTGLNQGTTYYFTVTPFTSGVSVQAANTTYITAKTATLAKTGLRFYSSTYTSVTLTWSRVPGANGYVIYRYNGRYYAPLTTITSGNVTAYVNHYLSTNATYYYMVYAYAYSNGKTIYSQASNAVAARPTLNSSITRVTGGKKKATVRWTWTPGASGYKIYRSTKAGRGYKLVKTIKRGSTTSYTDKTKKKGNYYYIVKPYRNYKSGKKTKTMTGYGNNCAYVYVR